MSAPAATCDESQFTDTPFRHHRGPGERSICDYCKQPILVLEFGIEHDDPQKRTFRKRWATKLTVIEWP